MLTDPVLLLMEHIHASEQDLHMECQRNSTLYNRARADIINRMLTHVRGLYENLAATAPTSARGAAALIRIAANQLPHAYIHYGPHLEQVADRLETGHRLHKDLVWLRALVDVLKTGMPNEDSGDRNDRAAALLALAIRGAAQPVLVHRMLTAPHGAVHKLAQFSVSS